MKTKLIPNFYFFEVRVTNTTPSSCSKFCIIGTASLPHGSYVEDLKYAGKIRKFINKKNVYHVSSPTSNQHSNSQKFISLDSKLSLFKPFYVLDDVHFNKGEKKPFVIGKNRTGYGSYYFYKKRLYLSESVETLHEFVDGTLTINSKSENSRERIPDDVQMFVWNRDNGECVKCGTNENLAFDHIIPFSKGGSNTKRNLQILCDSCNSKKGNKIGG